jgi:hypothetical protein
MTEFQQGYYDRSMKTGMPERTVELYRLIGTTEVDPGDGSLRPTIEDVLTRGFHAMGWATPTLAAYEACYAVAQRLAEARG